ncbi:glycosyltransferase family 4 protein [Desulfosoma caldarium]|uniref:Alpha-1,3-rhamnosyl/mannosyltransferase n=1 Tax=Desulfosoma caldarium TaxID=610254 RepID=A0A3N1VSD9_9BACT|nr:glycosyltransferase family 1 protein [Desulfosoma caldarium]ROR03142.1 alpha-1,3-rhamnosyl/mannosyltransferase [Desulfosoma caldarium]
MRILVDVLPLVGLDTGIARYLRNLYGTIEALPDPPSMDIVYFDGRKTHLSIPRAAQPARWSKAVTALWRLPAPVTFTLRCARWIAYEQQLQRITKPGSYDLYHATSFVPAAVTDIPQVFSLYDLSLICYPQTHPTERVWFFRYWSRRRLDYATHILTISQYMREEICRLLGWPEEKVTAVPLAPARHFSPRPLEAVALVRKRLGLPKEYLLFVGSLEPRKNIGLAVQALTRCRHDIPLVLVGWTAWGDKRWLAEAQLHRRRPRLIALGYTDDETLACLYSGATALVYPSLYEGFGLPILEAMACGCPVICSNTSSMPEVAGEAAHLIDPLDPQDLASAIDQVLDASDYRQHLIRAGLKRAAGFSWERTARQTRSVFQAILSEARS